MDPKEKYAPLINLCTKIRTLFFETLGFLGPKIDAAATKAEGDQMSLAMICTFGVLYQSFLEHVHEDVKKSIVEGMPTLMTIFKDAGVIPTAPGSNVFINNGRPQA